MYPQDNEKTPSLLEKLDAMINAYLFDIEFYASSQDPKEMRQLIETDQQIKTLLSRLNNAELDKLYQKYQRQNSELWNEINWRVENGKTVDPSRERLQHTLASIVQVMDEILSKRTLSSNTTKKATSSMHIASRERTESNPFGDGTLVRGGKLSSPNSNNGEKKSLLVAAKELGASIFQKEDESQSKPVSQSFSEPLSKTKTNTFPQIPIETTSKTKPKTTETPQIFPETSTTLSSKTKTGGGIPLSSKTKSSFATEDSLRYEKSASDIPFDSNNKSIDRKKEYATQFPEIPNVLPKAKETKIMPQISPLYLQKKSSDVEHKTPTINRPAPPKKPQRTIHPLTHQPIRKSITNKASSSKNIDAEDKFEDKFEEQFEEKFEETSGEFIVSSDVSNQSDKQEEWVEVTKNEKPSSSTEKLVQEQIQAFMSKRPEIDWKERDRQERELQKIRFQKELERRQEENRPPPPLKAPTIKKKGWWPFS